MLHSINMILDKSSSIVLINDVMRLSGLSACEEVSLKIYDFLVMLYKQNQVINLVSVRSFQELIQIHLVDSLAPFKMLPDLFIVRNKPLTGIDIGSGGGFPVLPISIVLQDSTWIMVESIQKKASFLRKAIVSLQLKQSIIVPFRLEDFIKSCPIPPLDIVTIRAVGKIEVIYPYIQVFKRRRVPVILWKHPDEIEKFNQSAKEPLVYQDFPYPVNNGYKHILKII